MAYWLVSARRFKWRVTWPSAPSMQMKRSHCDRDHPECGLSECPRFMPGAIRSRMRCFWPRKSQQPSERRRADTYQPFEFREAAFNLAVPDQVCLRTRRRLNTGVGGGGGVQDPDAEAACCCVLDHGQERDGAEADAATGLGRSLTRAWKGKREKQLGLNPAGARLPPAPVAVLDDDTRAWLRPGLHRTHKRFRVQRVFWRRHGLRRSRHRLRCVRRRRRTRLAHLRLSHSSQPSQIRPAVRASRVGSRFSGGGVWPTVAGCCARQMQMHPRGRNDGRSVLQVSIQCWGAQKCTEPGCATTTTSARRGQHGPVQGTFVRSYTRQTTGDGRLTSMYARRTAGCSCQ